MNSRTPVFGLALWSLLSLWIFFGGLELAEQLQLVPETAAEDQQGQDLDEEALSQLASGLKPDGLSAPSLSATPAAVPTGAIPVPVYAVHQHPQLTPQHPASLTLHKQLSVYRI